MTQDAETHRLRNACCGSWRPCFRPADRGVLYNTSTNLVNTPEHVHCCNNPMGYCLAGRHQCKHRAGCTISSLVASHERLQSLGTNNSSLVRQQYLPPHTHHPTTADDAPRRNRHTAQEGRRSFPFSRVQLCPGQVPGRAEGVTTGAQGRPLPSQLL